MRLIIFTTFFAFVFIVGTYFVFPGVRVSGSFMTFERDENINIIHSNHKDMDGDGLYDWEELLWRTNPEKKDSNNDGISDKDAVIIQQTKNKVDITLDSSHTTNTDSSINTVYTNTFTDEVVNTFLSQQKNNISENTSKSIKKDITSLLNNEIDLAGITRTGNNKYTIVDLLLTTSTRENIKIYKSNLVNIFNDFKNLHTEKDLVIIQNFVNRKTGYGLIQERANAYKELSNTLLNIKVPSKISLEHINMVNAYYGISVSLTNIGMLFEDPFRSIIGFEQLQHHLKMFYSSTNEIGVFLQKNTVID